MGRARGGEGREGRVGRGGGKAGAAEGAASGRCIVDAWLKDVMSMKMVLSPKAGSAAFLASYHFKNVCCCIQTTAVSPLRAQRGRAQGSVRRARHALDGSG